VEYVYAWGGINATASGIIDSPLSPAN